MLTGMKVLIVEDDLDDQFLFAEAFRELQPKVIFEIANDGQEAIEKLKSSKAYDFIFMDLNMPKMNGFECLAYLKADPILKDIPVIIISTSKREEDITRSKNLGAASYYTKPPSFDELFKKLKHLFLNPSVN